MLPPPIIILEFLPEIEKLQLCRRAKFPISTLEPTAIENLTPLRYAPLQRTLAGNVQNYGQKNIPTTRNDSTENAVSVLALFYSYLPIIQFSFLSFLATDTYLVLFTKKVSGLILGLI